MESGANRRKEGGMAGTEQREGRGYPEGEGTQKQSSSGKRRRREARSTGGWAGRAAEARGGPQAPYMKGTNVRSSLRRGSGIGRNTTGGTDRTGQRRKGGRTKWQRQGYR